MPHQFLRSGVTSPEWLWHNQLPPDLYTSRHYTEEQIRAYEQDALMRFNQQKQAQAQIRLLTEQVERHKESARKARMELEGRAGEM